MASYRTPDIPLTAQEVEGLEQGVAHASRRRAGLGETNTAASPAHHAQRRPAGVLREKKQEHDSPSSSWRASASGRRA